jgi:flagellar basal-body rod protein FlgG
MMQATQSAANGMRAQQTRLDVVAANIANINTVGYKSARADFEDTLYTLMKDPVDDAEANNLRKGTGVRVSTTDRSFTGGIAQTTERKLDFAIEGEGFFTLADGNGNKYYTRNGNFSVSNEGDSAYLVNGDGYYVLTGAGERIQVPESGMSSIAEDGTITDKDGNSVRLGVVNFSNREGLEAVGDTCFRETANSGAPTETADAEVKQGFLERSNVDLGTEMTLMMRAQRSYSLASKALQTADDMDGLANNMR